MDTNKSENIKCSEDKFNLFIQAIEQKKIYQKTMCHLADAKSYFHRYRYIFDKHRVTLTFNTRASILSITSDAEAFDKFYSLYAETLNLSDTKSQPPTQPIQKPKKINQAAEPVVANTQNQSAKSNSALAKPNLADAPNQSVKPKATKQTNKKIQINNQPISAKDIPLQTQNSANINSNKSTVKLQKQSAKNSAVIEQNNLQSEYKDGLYFKNYPHEGLEEVIKRIKSFKGLSVKLSTTAATASNSEIKTHTIENKVKQKIYLRYIVKKSALQIQGKEFIEIPEILFLIYKYVDYKTAVSSYIEQSGEDASASSVEKKLKKLLPSAFEFLSEQSKKYFTFALIDINNEETRLSDYSALLSSPYKALERLIYDLQIAENIEVKMIGQAYERNDKGEYTLKSGYRKKIHSVIYNEVMSALYTEYFARRNYYMHADNTENFEIRAISDKRDVKRIFDDLLQIVNYNCTKLKEIGFTIEKRNK